MEDNNLLNDINSMTDEDLAGLSDEELSEIESFASVQNQEAVLPDENTKITPGLAAAAETEKAKPEETQGVGNWVAESAADMALAIGDKIPGTENLSAAVGTVMDYATGHEGGSLGDTFSNAKQRVRQAEEQAADRSPIATVTGNIISEGAQFAAGGAALGGLKGVKALAKIAPRATALIASISADAGIGLAQRYSEAETSGLQTVLESGKGAIAESLLGAAVGGVAGVGFKYGAKAIGKNVVGPIRNKLVALQTHNNVKAALNTMNVFTDSVGMKTDQFIGRLSKLGLGSAESAVTAGRASNMINKHIPNKLGGELDQLYTIASEKGVKIDTESLYGRVEDSLLKMYEASGNDVPVHAKKRIAQLLKGMKSEVMEQTKDGFIPRTVYREMDVKQAWKVVQEISNDVPGGKLSKFKDKALGEFRGEIKSVLGAAADTGDDVLKAATKKITEKNMDFQVIKTAQKMTKGSNTAQDSGRLVGNAVREVFTGGLFYGAGGIAGYAATGTKEGAFAGAALVGGAKALSNTPSALRAISGFADGAFDGKIRSKIAKYGLMGDWIQANIKSVPAAAAIGSRLNSILANQDADSLEIDKLVDMTGSIKNLHETPLGRTEESFSERSEDIMRVINDVNPDMGDQLLNMIRNGEDVGPVMSQISKMPEAKGLIEPGMGWNGKVYSEEEKQGLIEEVMGTSNISGSRKAQLIRSISETGEIPDLAAEPKREPMKYNPRDKGKVRY